MTSRKNQWTEEQQEILFQLQAEYGNRWSIIASKIPLKDDSSIKNKFYSTLRKGLRKINKYIVQVKKKNDPVRLKGYKPLQEMFITKLIAVADNNFEQKYEVKQKALELSSDIQKRVIQIAFNSKDYLFQQITDYNMEEQLLKDIQQFNKNCKKRKGKRRTKGQSSLQSENQLSQNPPLKQIKTHILKSPNLKESSKQCNKNVEINENIPRGSFLLPHTKKNIILSEQAKTEAKSQGRLKTYANSQLPEKEESKETQKKECSNQMNYSFSLVGKTQEFLIAAEQNNLQNSSSFNMSGSWFFQSLTSRDISKKISGYMTHPSPQPSEFGNSYTYGSFIKNASMTGSNMYESMNNVADLLSSGKFFQTMPEQKKTLSLLDQLPVFVPNSLVRSQDLQQSIEIPGTKEFFSGNSFQRSLNMTIANLFPMPQNIFAGPFDNIVQQYDFAVQGCQNGDKVEGSGNRVKEMSYYEHSLGKMKE